MLDEDEQGSLGTGGGMLLLAWKGMAFRGNAVSLWNHSVQVKSTLLVGNKNLNGGRF